MIKIEISVDEDGAADTAILKDNLLVGWRNLLREEQLVLLKALSDGFSSGLRNLNES